MNILSYNVRGLERGVKWSAIRRMVRKHNADILCLQETKKVKIDNSMCQAIWGEADVCWEMQPSINTAGGLLCLWNGNRFKVERKVSGRGFILLEGVWKNEAQKVHIINIYAPCDAQHRRELWDSLKQLKSMNPYGLWCLMGDFNSIRNTSERMGLSQRGVDDRHMIEFNEWIADLELEEPTCVGRKFTWFRPNGAAKSRLDRALVTAEWLNKWPSSSQFILNRNFSDHCPILLISKNVDWGPKPFRIFDCWLQEKSFRDAVTSCWSQVSTRGWGGFVLKEKIKHLKQKLKLWHKEHFGGTFKKVQDLEEEINKLEIESADRQLSSEECMKKKKLQQDLWLAAQSHESIMRQKARSKWVKEGDCNSRYFYLLLNSNRRSNAVNGVHIEGAWIDDPTTVKEEIFRFFQQRYQEPELIRPKLNGVSFNSIDQQQNQMLVGCFSEDEIKRAVWECGSDKSPGPDGLNFKFIKQFWLLLKPDIIRFLYEFHANGIFPKGGNASFIALLPKVLDPQNLSEFRPISLIGCVYKIVAKVLANRLKRIMPDIIDERQSALWLEGRCYTVQLLPMK